MKKYLRAFIIGSLFCIAFNYIAVVSLNRSGPILPSNQISSVSYIFLVFLVIFFNPLLRFFKLAVLKSRELIIIAVMCIAPAGVAGFGFVTEFIPMVGSLNNPIWTDKYQEHIIPNIQSNLYLQTDEAGFEAYNEGIQVRGKEAYPIFLPREGKILDYPSDLINYFFRGNPQKRSFWGDIPWRQWIVPLLSWGIFFAFIIMFFYSLNELSFKQWYVNEKLVFPHTELIQSVLGLNRDLPTKANKLIYLIPSFWFGFSISFLTLFYNGIVEADWISGLSPISLSATLAPYVSNTWLEPLGDVNLQIYFALIGLGFLLPAEISFSIWFFFLFYQLQAFIAVSSGYIPSVGSISGDFAYKVTFLSAQGVGALIVFCSICLWKIRHNLIAFIYKYIRPNASLDEQEIKANATTSLIFVASSVGIILFFVWAKVDIGFAILYYISILFITIICVRLVAETGLISFQLWFGPLHMTHSLGLLKLSFLLKVKSLINAFPIYSSIFVDIKTFMAPAMMTSRALLGNTKEKFAFPIAIGLGFFISLVVAIITSLALVYNLGLDSMHGWFYKSFANRVVFGTVNTFMENPDKLSQISTDNFIGVIIGSLTMVGLLMARKIFFWMPHPIGIFVYINPVIQRIWFSMFLAWVFKSFCVKYLKRDSYENVKCAFTGIFLGHLLVVCISAIMSILGLGNMGIDLNK